MTRHWKLPNTSLPLLAMTMHWERERSLKDTNIAILSRQKNSESKHLEGQKALDERHLLSSKYQNYES